MSAPIFRLVTFFGGDLVAPRSDSYVIVDAQVASPSQLASSQSQWRKAKHAWVLFYRNWRWRYNARTASWRPIRHNRTSMIVSHLLQTGHQASFVTTNPLRPFLYLNCLWHKWALTWYPSRPRRPSFPVSPVNPRLPGKPTSPGIPSCPLDPVGPRRPRPLVPGSPGCPFSPCKP